VSAIHRQSDWARLFRIACALIRQVNFGQPIIEGWALGGGTAMMLRIGHRESHDVDIFLADPQWLRFLDPQTHEFEFEVRPSDYEGDGAGFLKFAFEDLGEIDFIIGHAMTSTPTTQTDVQGEIVLLETVPEIITKKIYHRGAFIKPRDIFDIAAAGEHNADPVIRELRAYPDQVQRALATIDRLNPEFVNNAIADLAIGNAFRPIAATAIERAKALLVAV